MPTTDPKILNVIGDIERTIYYLVEHPQSNLKTCPWSQSSYFQKYVDISRFKDKNNHYIAEDLLMQSYFLQKYFFNL